MLSKGGATLALSYSSSRSEFHAENSSSLREASDGALRDSDKVQPGYRSVCMGDHKGGALAEEAHLQLLESVRISRERALSYGFPPPSQADGPWVSAYLDDAIAVEYGDGGADEVFNSALGVYHEHGVAPKEDRGVSSGVRTKVRFSEPSRTGSKAR